MRFILLAVSALGAVHEYKAEAHLLCELCVDTANYLANGNTAGMARLERMYPAYAETFGSQGEILAAHIEQKSVPEACKALKMCEDSDPFRGEEFAQPVLDEAIISEVNSDSESTWTAGRNMRFENATVAQLRVLLGTIVDPKWVYTLADRKEAFTREQLKDIPATFDGATQWPSCKYPIAHVRDQSACGSCWAFGSTEAFEDRICVSKAKQGLAYERVGDDESSLLSTEDTTTCCKGLECGGSRGCNGGQPTAAWEWFKRQGVVSGGDYDDIGKTDTCEPYKNPPCAHHVPPSAKYKKCPEKEYPTGMCKRQCSNSGFNTNFEKDKHHATEAYSLRSVAKIQADIVQYGSATAAFTVYADFPTYKSGVYTHKTGRALGGHAIKIQGWGTEDGTPYWLVANSWNEEWGDGGYFKILRGSDECGIESQVSAGKA